MFTCSLQCCSNIDEAFWVKFGTRGQFKVEGDIGRGKLSSFHVIGWWQPESNNFIIKYILAKATWNNEGKVVNFGLTSTIFEW